MNEYELYLFGLEKLRPIQYHDNIPFKIKNNGGTIPISTHNIIGITKAITFVGKYSDHMIKILFTRNVAVRYMFLSNYWSGSEIR